MALTRRGFLAGSTAATAAGLTAGPAWAQAMPMLTARAGVQRLGPSGYAETEIWGYDGQVPGPEMRVTQGARVERRLVNALPQPTTVHWHGIRIDNAMDGVPGLTQPAVAPGENFDYAFTAPDAGTYWYHSHNQNIEQVARGLYGPLIIEEPQAPDTDADLVLVLDDWRVDPGDMQITSDFDNGRDLSHAGRIGNLITVNGQFNASVSARRHQRLRLRLINAANARVFTLGVQGLAGWVMALDGMPLGAPQPLADRLTLAPAQRADLFVDVVAGVGDPAGLLSVERSGIFAIWDVDVGSGSIARRAAPVALPPNPLPDLSDPEAVPVSEMVMMGGAMRWLESAQMSQTQMDGRELAQLGKFWALNGQVGRADAPFLNAARGEAHRIRFVNETMWDHGMHLHGHHFRLIEPDGSLGPWRDTVLLRRGETREVLCVLDNPGDWLLHCHMLGHAHAGMLSWLRVT